MKINFLYLSLLFICMSTQIKAQEQPVSTTTIHKVGQTELKVSFVQPKMVNFKKGNSVSNHKRLWKKHVNGTTEIEFNRDVTVNNINLKAGKYLLLIFPGNDWKPKNDTLNAFPGNDWKPKDGNVKFPGNDWKPKNDTLNAFPGNDWKPKDGNVKFPGNDWKPKNDTLNAFPGNDWKPKDGNVKFPGNDWKPKNDTLNAFPGNDWKPKTDTLNTFPGNDWNPKDSKVNFPGNDWKPKSSKIAFPGNDWTPLNNSMDSFPGNDWLVVFYQYVVADTKKLDKNLIAAEIMVHPKSLLQPSVNLSANFMYSNPKNIQLSLSWDKTSISIPINIK